MNKLEQNLRLLAKEYQTRLKAWGGKPGDFGMMLILVECIGDTISEQERDEVASYLIENNITAEKLLKNYS